MSSLVLLVFGVIALVVGRIVAPRRRRSAATKRLLAGSRQLADGALVTVIGVIREPQKLAESPLSGRRGVFVLASAELPEIDEALGTGKYLVLTSNLLVPFELDTGAEVVVVDGTTATTLMRPSAVRPRSEARERAFLVAHGRGPEVAAAATFREVLIVPGTRVAVHGLARFVEGERTERGYRDAMAANVRIVAPEASPITIADPSELN